MLVQSNFQSHLGCWHLWNCWFDCCNLLCFLLFPVGLYYLLNNNSSTVFPLLLLRRFANCTTIVWKELVYISFKNFWCVCLLANPKIAVHIRESLPDSRSLRLAKQTTLYEIFSKPFPSNIFKERSNNL